ncbi:MAG: radical SAM protein [Myxococcales bacterium]|nr:radical SAM protein [Myxococcales bacterium]
MQRAAVQLLRACDGVCVTCAQVGLEDEGPRSRAEVQAELASLEAEGVTFVGGEPLLHPELEAIVGDAATRFGSVGLQTNGNRADPETLQRLARAGLTDVHLSLHGEAAPVHEYHTGVAGSFGRTLTALAGARAAGLAVGVTTVITRSNARNLPAIVRLVSSRGATAHSLAVPRVRGRAAERFDRVVPRLGIAVPFALYALQVAGTLRLPAFLRGAPLCLLGPHTDRALPSAPRAHGSMCEGCAARPVCPGVEPEYLARFAGDELAPRDDAPIAAAHPLFVGEGEVAPPLERAVPSAPAAARVALPMLGKVKPALAEVPRSAEKKTGEALQTLFGDLYREEGD